MLWFYASYAYSKKLSFKHNMHKNDDGGGLWFSRANALEAYTSAPRIVGAAALELVDAVGARHPLAA